MSRTFLLASHQVKKRMNFFFGPVQNRGCIHFHRVGVKEAGGGDLMSRQTKVIIHSVEFHILTAAREWHFLSPSVTMTWWRSHYPAERSLMFSQLWRGGGLMWAFSYIQLPRGRRSHMRHRSSRAGAWIKPHATTAIPFRKKQNKTKLKRSPGTSGKTTRHRNKMHKETTPWALEVFGRNNRVNQAVPLATPSITH